MNIDFEKKLCFYENNLNNAHDIARISLMEGDANRFLHARSIAKNISNSWLKPSHYIENMESEDY